MGKRAGEAIERICTLVVEVDMCEPDVSRCMIDTAPGVIAEEGGS